MKNLAKKELVGLAPYVLSIDIYCYECKRLVALSNATELEGKQYCYRCYTYLESPEELLERVLKEISLND